MAEEDLDNLYTLHRFTADKKQDPLRIDVFLMARIAGITRTKLRKHFDAGMVTVNGKVIKPNYKVRPSDEVVVHIEEEPEEFQLIPEDIPLDIVYEDDEVMVVNKPAGMVVHPGVGNPSGTLVNALAHYFGEKPAAGIQRPWLIHRIDKGTSGLLLIAKNENHSAFLSDQFKKHTIDREYMALVWGVPDPEVGTVEGYIGRSQTDRKKFTVLPEDAHGKYAVTHYEVLEDFQFTSLVKCRLETGRTHQIRVHMKHIGHTLFNDQFYGGDKIRKGVVFGKYRAFVQNCFNLMPRPALHARLLGFEHPTTHDRLVFEADPPPDFQQVLDKWRQLKDSYQF